MLNGLRIGDFVIVGIAGGVMGVCVSGGWEATAAFLTGVVYFLGFERGAKK